MCLDRHACTFPTDMRWLKTGNRISDTVAKLLQTRLRMTDAIVGNRLLSHKDQDLLEGCETRKLTSQTLSHCKYITEVCAMFY